MKRIQDANFTGKKVLMRVDFNVSVKGGLVQEEYKIAAAQESVKHVLSQSGAKLALVSHLGRPEGKANPNYSLGQLKADAERILGVKLVFAPDCTGENVLRSLESLGEGEVLLLENVRFHEGEEKNDPEFSRHLAEPFHVFVNEAFSVCHRDQASVTGVTQQLPSYAGFWLQKEVENLNRLMKNPDRPAVSVIGGAKIETKMPLINKFEEIYDTVLVGGKIANEAIDAKLTFSEKVILPHDFANSDRADIGPESTKNFVDIISTAKTVVWNGPMGKFEQPEFAVATDAVLKAIIDSGAFSVMGGGESVQLLEERGVLEKISFVSTGGGAMLEFLSGEPMPGLIALQ